MKIVLASGSPRRKEIMKNAGYDFEVKTSSADETLPENIKPDEAVKYLAEIKGDAVEVDESTLVVSADTVVALDGKILGKPKDENDAFSMLFSSAADKTSVLNSIRIIVLSICKVFLLFSIFQQYNVLF